MADLIDLYKQEKQIENPKANTVESILGTVRVAAETAGEFRTIADKFIYDWGLAPTKRIDAGVSGNPPAPPIYDYPSQWSKESLDRSIQDIRIGAETLGRQIKGLFNIWYESPTDGQTASPITAPAGFGLSPIVILAIVGLIIFVGMKK